MHGCHACRHSIQKSIKYSHKHFSFLIDHLDNIYSRVIDPDMLSGDLSATISDPLPQFSKICRLLYFTVFHAINLIYMKRTGPNLIKKIILDHFSVV